MASSRPAPKPLELDITVVSAKHLKNVNWKHGELKPYAVFWLDPDRRIATKPDDSGSTRPVWNERFSLPIIAPLPQSLLTLEIFHSVPSDTPNPLVGTLSFPLNDLLSDHDPTTKPLRTLDLRRPSGRPHGKIRLKLSLRERPFPPPDFHPPPPPPQSSYYNDYSHSPYPAVRPPPPPSQYSYGNYSDPYSSYGGYYPSYYQRPPPPPPPQPFFDRPSANYGAPSGPSAPVDYSSSYDQKQKGGKMGLGTGLAVGAVAGALGGLALEEGIKYEEEKIAERVEGDIAARDDYNNFRGDY